MHRLERAPVVYIRKEPDLEQIPPDKLTGWKLLLGWVAAYVCSVGVVAAIVLVLAALIRAAIRFPYWKWMVR